MAWHPGAHGYTRNDMILAVALQCSQRTFLVQDIVKWLGRPDQMQGTSDAGNLAYHYSGDYGQSEMFDVLNGKIVHGGTMQRFELNAQRPPDEKTGKRESFNIFDEMPSYSDDFIQ